MADRRIQLPFGKGFQITEQGAGQVVQLSDRLRLLRPRAQVGEYSNAQIGDPSQRRSWREPVTLTVRARFSHPVAQLRGTLSWANEDGAVVQISFPRSEFEAKAGRAGPETAALRN